MHIWVDADACPGIVKDILFRASKRCEIPLTLVANQSIGIPKSDWIECVVVSHGADVADGHIVDVMSSGDLVVTADIPLAARVVEKGGQALDPRGELLTEANVKTRLATRDFMESLRGSGIETGGPAAFTQKDGQAFANQLDRILTKRRKV